MQDTIRVPPASCLCGTRNRHGRPIECPVHERDDAVESFVAELARAIVDDAALRAVVVESVRESAAQERP